MSSVSDSLCHWRCGTCGGLATTGALDDVVECGPCGAQMVPVHVFRKEDVRQVMDAAVERGDDWYAAATAARAERDRYREGWLLRGQKLNEANAERDTVARAMGALIEQVDPDCDCRACTAITAARASYALSGPLLEGDIHETERQDA